MSPITARAASPHSQGPRHHAGPGRSGAAPRLRAGRGRLRGRVRADPAGLVGGMTGAQRRRDRSRSIRRHSGARRRREPGIHNHSRDYGFRAPSLRSGPGMTAEKTETRLAASSGLVAALALERGRRCAGLHHHRARLTTATALTHELRRQLHDRSGRRCHGLIALGSQLGLGERWSSTPLFHRASFSARQCCAVWAAIASIVGASPPNSEPGLSRSLARPKGGWPS